MFKSGTEYANMIYVALTPAQMTTNLQIHLRAAGTEDMKQYTVRSFGWEGRGAIKMDRTAMGIFMEYVG